jgi:hypothetical protein
MYLAAIQTWREPMNGVVISVLTAIVATVAVLVGGIFWDMQTTTADCMSSAEPEKCLKVAEPKLKAQAKVAESFLPNSPEQKN